MDMELEEYLEATDSVVVSGSLREVDSELDIFEVLIDAGEFGVYPIALHRINKDYYVMEDVVA